MITHAWHAQELQGQLADYNLMNEKLNTHVGIDEVRATSHIAFNKSHVTTPQVVRERDEIKARNDREAANIDVLFEERKRCVMSRRQGMPSHVVQQGARDQANHGRARR